MPLSPTPKALNATADGTVSTHAGLRISEVMSDNASAFPDETGRFGDWVEIENTLDTPINMKDVGLSDRADRIKFLFPDVTLNAHGRVVVFCDSTNKDAPHGEFHAKFKLSSLGDSVYLFDANGIAGKRPALTPPAIPTLRKATKVIWPPSAFSRERSGSMKWRPRPAAA